MSRGKHRTLAQAWLDLNYQLAHGKPIPSTRPAALSLRQIKEWPEVFQHRSPGEHSTKTHVKELAAAASRGPLDPILVWWDGKHWTCIDGHHRLAAYRSAQMAQAVPVQIFEGSSEQALIQAAASNTHDKLPMSHTEKLNAAWRLVTTTAASKAETTRASGASERTVAHMRNARDAVRALGKDPADMRWEEARRLAAGEAPLEDVDWDTRTEQEARDIANKLLGAFGKRVGRRVDALARALEIYDARLPRLLTEVWVAQGEPEVSLDD